MAIMIIVAIIAVEGWMRALVAKKKAGFHRGLKR